MRTLIVATVLMLAACATATPVALPNGSKGYSIDCGGPYDIHDCMNKAAEVCKGPYQIWGRDSSNAGGVLMPVGAGAMLIPAENRIMIVSCGH